MHLSELVGARIAARPHAELSVAVLGAGGQLVEVDHAAAHQRQHQPANNSVSPAVAVDAERALHGAGERRGGGRWCDKVGDAHDLEVIVKAEHTQLAPIHAQRARSARLAVHEPLHARLEAVNLCGGIGEPGQPLDNVAAVGVADRGQVGRAAQPHHREEVGHPRVDRRVAVDAHHVLRVAQRGVVEDVEGEELEHVVVTPARAVVRRHQAPWRPSARPHRGGRAWREVDPRRQQQPLVRAQRFADGTEDGARHARLVEEDERVAPAVVKEAQCARHPLHLREVRSASAEQRDQVARCGCVGGGLVAGRRGCRPRGGLFLGGWTGAHPRRRRPGDGGGSGGDARSNG
mmetsp:Transcript_27791/g.90421  ORF Transcript_27791/g.90421 Transcript_27791/m.90421 type:complete len:347 (-) Transcript_27791:156-1196(-)